MPDTERFDRRKYQRTSASCEAKFSVDGRTWTDFNVADLSSGGLRLFIKEDFEIGTRLSFHIVLYGLSSEFVFKADGIIRRKDFAKFYYVYGIGFVDLSQDAKIQIDEMITHMRPRDYYY